MVSKTYHNRGITLVEVIFVASVIVLFFGGLFSGVMYTFEIIGSSKAKLTALSVATSQIEYVRSLSYNAVGTVAGIPPGAIPQVSTTTNNNILFTVRTLVSYVDDPADGIGGSDNNGITTDYKQAKVTVSWEDKGIVDEVMLVTNVIPRSIETDVGGGTLRVNVFDANVMPLPGIDVRLVNATMTPAINVTRTTDSTGAVLFGGAPAGSEYEIFVSKPGYSSDQTYRASTSLPFPSVLPVSVVEADISTVNFFVDRLSTITVTAFDTLIASTTNISWSSLGSFATSSNLNVVTNTVLLNQTGGFYAASGTGMTTIAPAAVDRWETVSVTAIKPASTSVTVRFYTGSTTYSLISDTDLPGNAIGFSGSSIDLSSLDAATYPILVLETILATASTTITPTLSNLRVDYIESESRLGSVPLTFTGAKTIGTNSIGGPVYKNTYTGTTNSVGELTVGNVEWDSYTVRATGYDITEACAANPLPVTPNTVTPLTLILGSNTAHSLRVVTETTAGVPIVGATVTLSRPGYNETRTTSECGQVYFGGLSSASDYTITATAPSLGTRTTTEYGINGDGSYVIQW
jgi:hypothetical protein